MPATPGGLAGVVGGPAKGLAIARQTLDVVPAKTPPGSVGGGIDTYRWDRDGVQGFVLRTRPSRSAYVWCRR